MGQVWKYAAMSHVTRIERLEQKSGKGLGTIRFVTVEAGEDEESAFRKKYPGEWPPQDKDVTFYTHYEPRPADLEPPKRPTLPGELP